MLLPLLEVWKERRIYPVARAIHRLSRPLLQRHLSLADPLAWHKLAARRDPMSVPALLAAPVRTDLQALRRQLAVLAEFAADPRIALFGRRWLDVLRRRAELQDEAWGRALTLWQQHGPIEGSPIRWGPVDGLSAMLLEAEAQPTELEDALLAEAAVGGSSAAWSVYLDWLAEQEGPRPDWVRWSKHRLGQADADLLSTRSLPGHPALRAQLEGRLSVGALGAEVVLCEPCRDDLLWVRDQGLSSLALSFLEPEGLSEAESVLGDNEVRALTLVHPCWVAGRHRCDRWRHLERLTLPLVPGQVRLDPGFLGWMTPRELTLVDTISWIFSLREVVQAAVQAPARLMRVRISMPRSHREVSLLRDRQGQLRRLRLESWTWASTLQTLLADLPQGALTELDATVPSHQLEDVQALLGARGMALLLRPGPG